MRRIFYVDETPLGQVEKEGNDSYLSGDSENGMTRILTHLSLPLSSSRLRIVNVMCVDKPSALLVLKKERKVKAPSPPDSFLDILKFHMISNMESDVEE